MRTKEEKYHIRETENCGNCKLGNIASNIDYWCNRHKRYIDTHCICDLYKEKEWHKLRTWATSEKITKLQIEKNKYVLSIVSTFKPFQCEYEIKNTDGTKISKGSYFDGKWSHSDTDNNVMILK